MTTNSVVLLEVCGLLLAAVGMGGGKWIVTGIGLLMFLVSVGLHYRYDELK